MIRKILIQSLIILFIGILFIPNRVFASEPSFSFYPSGGTITNKDNGFIVDIVIDSGGQEISSAQFTVIFDPEYLQLKKAERNNSLFMQYPEDESTLDNENGVVMLTGFTQSGTGNLYVTGDKADVLARLTFQVLKEGETVLDWEFGGENASFDTVMYKDGSPPMNILNTRPLSATFSIGANILDPSNVNTGISLDKYILVIGGILILFGAFMVFTKPHRFRKGGGTVIEYDGE